MDRPLGGGNKIAKGYAVLDFIPKNRIPFFIPKTPTGG